MTRIQYLIGDIFDSKAQVIVNTVNCKGVMGKGLALAFKKKYPAMFKVYQQDCKTGKLRIGRPTLYQETTPWILNFPTKYDWRFPSKLEYLEKGLEFLVANYKKAGIKSIAFPKLGAQNGKLSWHEVGPLMAKYLSQLDIDVSIYIAEGDTEYQHEAEAEENIWKRFNQIALSQERLHQEVKLSCTDAKKVAHKRKSMEYTSLADIASIGKIAQISLKRIKDYINGQKYTPLEIAGMQSTSKSHQPVTKNTTKSQGPKRKKSDKAAVISAEPLFSEKELVSQ